MRCVVYAYVLFLALGITERWMEFHWSVHFGPKLNRCFWPDVKFLRDVWMDDGTFMVKWIVSFFGGSYWMTGKGFLYILAGWENCFVDV